MSDELVFYTHPMSRGRIARWMLEETGHPYRTETLEFGTTMKAEPYLAVNPMGKVPAIRHGDTVVTECAAICAYLADAFPEAGLAPPPADRRRGPYYRWLFFAAGPVEAAVSNQALGFVVPEGRERMMGYGSYADALNMLESAVSQGPYVAGAASPPRMWMSARRSAGACNSAPSRSVRLSRAIGSASAAVRPRCAPRRSTTRWPRRGASGRAWPA